VWFIWCVPFYVAGILNSVEKIHFFELHSEEVNYAVYDEKCIVGKDCTFKLPTDYSFKVFTEHGFQLTFGDSTVTIIIQARQFQILPSELIFAQCVPKNRFISANV
jgi:hypothetical protein